MTPAAMDLIQRVLDREGGIRDVGDGKGVTRFGQTPGWLQEFGLEAPNTEVEAAVNYAKWLVMTGLDAVTSSADSAADFTIDFAVHSGHVPAIKALQRALGVSADGTVGPKTRAALDGAQRVSLAFQVISEEMRYQGRAITNHPARHAQYAHGWANRNADKLLLLEQEVYNGNAKS